MTKLTALLLTLLTVCAAQATTYSRRVTLDPVFVRAVDGDTIVYRGKAIRIVGLNAPETHGVCATELQLGQQARQQARYWVQGSEKIQAKFVVDKSRTTHKTVRSHDKYGRYLAIVWVEGENWADKMIGMGLAKPWSGTGPRPGWC